MGNTWIETEPGVVNGVSAEVFFAAESPELRLALLAAEMMRLLVDAEWSGHDAVRRCPWCDTHGDHSGRHAVGCAWVAVMAGAPAPSPAIEHKNMRLRDALNQIRAVNVALRRDIKAALANAAEAYERGVVDGLSMKDVPD